MSATNPALQPDALFAKSQLYIRRGLRAQGEDDTEEYQLWASLALELLGKAALAKVHPVLIADPTHYQSVFAACGRQLSADIKTIMAKTLFERLGHIDKAFDKRHQAFCEQMALRRNSELHSGESPFSGMSATAWESEFWGAVETILNMQNASLELWLGVEEAKAPTKIIENAVKALSWVVKNRVSRCKIDFEKQSPDPTRRQALIEGSKDLQWNDRNWEGRDRAVCPACKAMGFVGGTLWREEILGTEAGTTVSTPDGEIYEELPVEIIEKFFSVEAFECLVCGLRLANTKEIAAAGLDDEFSRNETREIDYEPDYGND